MMMQILTSFPLLTLFAQRIFCIDALVKFECDKKEVIGDE